MLSYFNHMLLSALIDDVDVDIESVQEEEDSG